VGGVRQAREIRGHVRHNTDARERMHQLERAAGTRPSGAVEAPLCLQCWKEQQQLDKPQQVMFVINLNRTVWSSSFHHHPAHPQSQKLSVLINTA